MAIASSTETRATARSAAPFEGKSSRVMPTKDTITAQAANRPPQTWKAFTAATLANASAQFTGWSQSGALWPTTSM